MLSIIVAVASNNAIGKGNDMPWHLSEDLKYFKRVTSGHAVIMGTNTFASIGSRPLPKRRNIVVSKKQPEGLRDGVEYFNSLPQAIESACAQDEEVFIMGGGMIYAAALPLADRLYITEVDTVIEDAEVFFPPIDRNMWCEASRSGQFTDEKSGLKFSFVVYNKR